MPYCRDSDLLKLINDAQGDECVFAPGKPGSGKHYARRALIARCGPKPFNGAVCRHLCHNDSQVENTCIRHTEWSTVSQNTKDCAHKIGWGVYPPTPEQRAKSAKTRTGKTQKNKGRPLSPEHRARLSEAAKNRYNKGESNGQC